jgi:YggT family protein
MEAIWAGLRAVISFILNMVQYLVFGSVIVSWLNADRDNPVVRLIHQTTEPMFRPLRKFTNKIPGPLDWAPMVVLMIIIFLQAVIARL